jgi:hypothetical protein
MRKLARLQGIPQKTGVELSLMDRFFLFQVIVRSSCALLDRIAHKSTSDRLSGRRIFVGHHCGLTWSGGPPDRSAVTSGYQSSKIFHVLPDVSVANWLF